MNNTVGGFKSLMEKLFDDSLEKSKFMNKVIDNITIIASEFTRLTEIMVTINNRINQHEQAISLLLNVHNEKNKQDNIAEFMPKGKNEPPSKPN